MKKVLYIFSYIICIYANAQDFGTLTIQDNEYNKAMSIEFTENTQYMLVSEKNGFVYVSDFVNGTYVKRNEPIITIGGNIPTEIYEVMLQGGEQGLLDIAYKNNQVWLLYSVNRASIDNTLVPQGASINRLTRYDVDLENNTSSNRTVILGANDNLITGIPILAPNHVGGSIGVFNDGSMFITTGDGSSGQYTSQAFAMGILDSNITYTNGDMRAMQLNSCNGKILRINPNTGEAMPDNPFYDALNPNSCKSKVYNSGLRNTFRAKIHNDTIVNCDVGEDLYESLKLSTAAAQNHGWAMREGYSEEVGAGVVGNPDENTSYNSLFIIPQNLDTPEDINERIWTWKPPILTYHEDNYHVQTINNDMSVNTIPVNFKGVSIVGGEKLTDDNYDLKNGIAFGDFFGNFLAVYKDKEVTNLEVNGLNYVVDMELHPLTHELYILEYTGNVKVLTYDPTLSVPSYHEIPRHTPYQVINMQGQVLGNSLDNVSNGVYILKYENYKPIKIIK